MDNPYESPSPTRPITARPSAPIPRPLGISILAVLHLIGGVLLLGTQFLLFANLEAMAEGLETVGIPPLLLVFGVMFLAIVTTAAGVGMWLGAKWGWWCGAFYYAYSVFRNASALITVNSMADQLELGGRGPTYYLIKHSVRIILHALLLLYFFKGNVLEYFGMESVDKRVAVALLFGICMAIGAAATAISLLSR